MLQEGQFERVGEERTRDVDVRVIAATNRDLQARGAARPLPRGPLFPAERVPDRVWCRCASARDDIPLLAAHFLREACKKLNIGELRLTEGDARRLSQYDWPGNVRELQNVIERAAILARNGRLRIDLPDHRRHAPPARRRATAVSQQPAC